MAQRLSRRQRVVQRAGYRCEYCGYPQEASPIPLEVDHIIPQAKGGRTTLTNLALACRRCNQHKGTKTTGIDPETQQSVRLFNPRSDRWAEHFQFI
jgi:5-methylcytosine-specific restriction endonuclease McrA